jgi:hypothetical protein
MVNEQTRGAWQQGDLEKTVKERREHGGMELRWRGTT